MNATVLFQRIAVSLVCLLMFGKVTSAQLEFDRPPINYSSAEVHEAVAKLKQDLESGQRTLSYEPEQGYLRSLLTELKIPSSSQTLVFSKTSLQLRRISPDKPRALYFNDDIYVGWVQDGDVLELSAVDPDVGPVFYTLAQKAAEIPSIVRDQGHCLTCHASSRTQGVPGFVMRSVYSDPQGQPHYGSGTFTLDHRTPLKDRWGGWYVTGTHGTMRHLGNLTSNDGHYTPEQIESGANVLDLSAYFNLSPYIEPTSDIVALMVLEHQTQMHNFLTLANHETRIALEYNSVMAAALGRPTDELSESTQRRIASVGDKLLRHLLFVDEFPLTAPIQGNSRFTEEFQAPGPRDSQGRSLREFDLHSRMFKYPCSFLIHSESFHALPRPVRDYVMTQLQEVLTAETPAREFAHLTAADRRAILEMLLELEPDLFPVASPDSSREVPGN